LLAVQQVWGLVLHHINGRKAKQAKGVFDLAVSCEKTVVNFLLYKSCCELIAVKKLKVVWFIQL
jgi:hypothetical protein